MMKKEMINNITISVIIPSYNTEKYIGKAIESVQRQNISSIEIICVDDCSTDNTREIINAYSLKDNRIKVICNDTNMGAGYCRNKALEVSMGKYVHFLDSDDWIEDNAYQILLSHIEQNENIDFCMFCYSKYNNESGEKTYVNLFNRNNGTLISFENDYEMLLTTSVVPWNKLYNRDFIIKNNLSFDEISCANDRTFYFTSIVNASRIMLVNESLINYRINNPYSLVESGRSNGFINHARAFDSSYRKIGNRLTDDQVKVFMKSELMDLLHFYDKSNCSKQAYDIIIDLLKKYNSIFSLLSDDFFDFVSGPKAKVLVDISSTEFSIDKTIPIVFATNENYAPYLGVAIQSLIRFSNSDYCYRIYIMHSGISERYLGLLLSLSTNNCEISFLNVRKMIESQNNQMYSRAHYSVEMYYRMLIPEIFRPYSKVLYLDCDTVINRDVFELYMSDIGNNYIGAVVNISSCEMKKYIKNQLGIDPNNYINSGVLLLNINELFNDKIPDRFFKLIDERNDFVCPDQDVINIVCENKIFNLDIRWNFQWYYSILDDKTKNGYDLEEYIKQSYHQAEINPYIIHYTSGIKAWNNPEKNYSIYFWEVAKNSAFFLEIITKNITKIIDKAVNAEVRDELKKQNDTIAWNREERKRLENENKVLLSLIKDNKSVNVDLPSSMEEQQYKYQVEEIRKSFSYKLGLFLTWLPRKIRSAISREK